MLRRRKIALKRRQLSRWPTRRGLLTATIRRLAQRRKAKYYNHP